MRRRDLHMSRRNVRENEAGYQAKKRATVREIRYRTSGRSIVALCKPAVDRYVDRYDPHSTTSSTRPYR